MTSTSSGSHQCLDCGDFFQHKNSLSTHVKKKRCFPSLFTKVIRNCIKTNNEIVQAVSTTRLKFYTCQRLGVFERKLFPLSFCELPDSLKELEAVLFHLVPQIPLIEANDGVSRQFFGLKVTQSGLKCISIGYNILFYVWEL